MNEEEAKERLNRFKTIKVLYGNTYSMHLEQLEQLKNDIDTVLNLLEKKDIDIIETKEANRQLSVELQKKDKMINDMALNIKELADLDYSIKEIIENFERKLK